MNYKQLYEEAWHKLLAARQAGDLLQVRVWAEEVAHYANLLHRERLNRNVMCSHTPDSHGICTRCGYNFNQPVTHGNE